MAYHDICGTVENFNDKYDVWLPDEAELLREEYWDDWTMSDLYKQGEKYRKSQRNTFKINMTVVAYLNKVKLIDDYTKKVKNDWYNIK